MKKQRKKPKTKKLDNDLQWSYADRRAYEKAKREKEKGETLTLEQVKQELGL
ncbi:hypothetical protein [Helicobacter brantae]|uniref:hypothetical protein n=1 Tax=Helicobacter brantae TaxID=375927 RepID=UPI001474DE86|nr:hypothetical protein [Helicobacter brantae]